MIRFLPFVLLILFATNCGTTNHRLENVSVENPLIGTWNLVKSASYGPNDQGIFQLNETSLLALECTYLFSEDGTVSISKNHLAYSKGNYSYRFYEGYLGPEGTGDPLQLLEIGTFTWVYTLEDQFMKLSLLHVDGPVIYLEKAN
ncbi:MAG: hypothetical protein R2773_05720 [Flavobacteriaceae bacterium]